MAAFRRKHLAKHGVAEAVTLATLTAMIGYANRFLRIDMTSSMAILFRECEGGGNVNNLCQYAPSRPQLSTPLTRCLSSFKNTGSVAHLELALPRDRYSHRARRHFVWGQGACRYLRALHGHWGDIRQDGGHHG